MFIDRTASLSNFEDSCSKIRICGIYTKETYHELSELVLPRLFRLYGQANKRIWWMPRQLEAMKDVVACDKLRLVGKQTFDP